ncbi:hypothetical protein [Auraticoccus monumenti]|uniref:Uncharacterized protein n=1 Tax=Auraticoccus monumenti TaxID=675864 RepID=A0A1G6XJ02_9ACTN|nr:hypothetical protein [Auraticoccus monumenti]SDD78150.1 hypothetical protein SAMN04489747_1727 [Auraticoccus monumenti]
MTAVWTDAFEDLLPELLQQAYEHAGFDDHIEQIWLLGLDDGRLVRAGVAYRLAGKVLDAEQVVARVVDAGDPRELLDEQRRSWERLFARMEEGPDAVRQVRVTYDVAQADARTDFEYDAPGPDAVTAWYAALS